MVTLADPGAAAADSSQPSQQPPQQQPTEPRLIPLIATEPGGSRIAVAWLLGSTVESYSATDGQKLGPSIETRSSISALALAAQGQLATAAIGVVRMWDLETQAQVASLSPQQGFIARLDYNRDGTLLAVSGPGNDVEVWDPAAAQLVAALPTTERVEGVAFDPTGRWLAIGQSSSVQLWAIVEPDAQDRLTGLPGVASGLTFLTDGSLAMTVWDKEGNEPARRWVPRPSPTLTPVLASYRIGPLVRDADGQLVTVGVDRPDPSAGGGPILSPDQLLWFDPNDRDGPPMRSIVLDRGNGGSGGSLGPGGGRSSWNLVASANGRALLALARSQGPEPRPFLWLRDDQPDTLREILPPAGYDSMRGERDRDRERDRFGGRRRDGGGGPPPEGGPPPPDPGAGAAPGERRSGGSRGPAVGDAGPIGLRSGSNSSVWLPLGLGPRGETLFVLRADPATRGRELAVWNLAHDDGRLIRATETRRVAIEATADGSWHTTLSPDGALLAESRRPGRVAVIDAVTGRDRGLLPQDSEAGEIQSLAFAPDGRTLAAGNHEGVVRVWTLDATGAAVGPPLVLPGHRGSVFSLAFSPDAGKLATSGEDKTLVVWDLARLEQELSGLGLGTARPAGP
jgi:WD40 repeat protein